MHVVIVCDSKFGNTAQVARAAQTALAAGNTVDLRSATEGIGDLTGVDLLLVGGPTHAHGASVPLKEALGALPARLPGRDARGHLRHALPHVAPADRIRRGGRGLAPATRRRPHGGPAGELLRDPRHAADARGGRAGTRRRLGPQRDLGKGPEGPAPTTDQKTATWWGSAAVDPGEMRGVALRTSRPGASRGRCPGLDRWSVLCAPSGSSRR